MKEFKFCYQDLKARSVTSMLTFIIAESFRIYKYYCESSSEFKRFIGKWVRSADVKSMQLLAVIIGKINTFIEEAESKNFENIDPCKILQNIYDSLYSKSNGCYMELCKIFPSDTVAFHRIQSSISDLSMSVEGGKDMILSHLDKNTLDVIRDIIGKTLNIKKEVLVHGSILVDFPKQSVSKKKEFLKFSVVNDQGYGRHVGRVWDAIESDFAENTKVIRIFIKPDIITFDREDSVNVRSALISRLS